MGKLLGGFILGFLSCVWTYGLDPGEAVFGFSHKLAIAHEQIEQEYRVDARHGHKGQYGARPVPHTSVSPSPDDGVANSFGYWLSRSGGPSVM
jgi:hypothetical protein